MSVVFWLDALHREAGSRAYITRLEILDQSQTMLKARLYISPDLFVQVYRYRPFQVVALRAPGAQLPAVPLLQEGNADRSPPRRHSRARPVCPLVSSG